jgi:hypothetical protein
MFSLHVRFQIKFATPFVLGLLVSSLNKPRFTLLVSGIVLYRYGSEIVYLILQCTSGQYSSASAVALRIRLFMDDTFALLASE